MGQEGTLNLINSTMSDWILKAYSFYQMRQWNFPPIIKAGSCEQVFIEWDQGIFTYEADDKGEVVYELNDTGEKFEIRAHSKPFTIEVHYKEMQIEGRPKGSVENLGWRENGHITFMLKECQGKYVTHCL